MRNDILKILDSYPASAIKKLPLAKGELYLIGEREQTISALTALMCYREVRAFCRAFVNGQGCTALEMANKYLLKQGYSTQDIDIAIEQIKTEQK